MWVNVMLIAVGLACALSVAPVRDRYRGWADGRYATWVTFGYLFPLFGPMLILLGTGMFWEPRRTSAWNVVLLVCLVLALACLCVGLLAILGLRLPPFMLPRWLRDSDRPHYFTQRRTP